MKLEILHISFTAACLSSAVLIYFLYAKDRGESFYPSSTENTRVIRDAAGRDVRIPNDITGWMPSRPLPDALSARAI